MADNVTADAGSGGAVFATDDIGPGVHYPITKITIGALNSQTLLSGGNGTVDAGTVRVTVASDSTGVLSVDDNGGALTVDWAGVAPPIGAGTEAAALRVTLATDSTGVVTIDNAGTFVVQEDGAALTALQLIDDTVFVDDTATHATGTTKVLGIGAVATPTDGSVDANDIGMPAMSLDRRLHVDADITASVALDVSAATITVAAHAVTNAGTFVVQEDGAALTALQLIDNAVSGAGFNVTQMNGVNLSMGNGVSGTGVQRVTIASDTTGVLTVDNAGTFATQVDGAALTALQLIDDIVYTDDTSTHATGTSKGAGIMAAATPTDAAVSANDIGMLAMSLDRRLHVDADITASVALDVSAATITVAAHAVTNAGTFVVQEDGAALTALQLIDNAVSGAGFNVTQMNGVNLTMGSGVAGTGVQRVSVATDDVVTVDLAGNNDVQGDIAHDAVNSGNPFQLGAQAIAHGTNPTAVAAADRTRLYANRAGVPFMIGGHPNVVTKSARNTGAQTDTALVTVAGGLKIVVTRVSLTVDNSCTVDVDFEVGFGTATVPTAATGAGVAGMVADFMGIQAGGGITIGDGSGMLGTGADGEDLRYSNTVPTTGNCTITVSYYTIES